MFSQEFLCDAVRLISLQHSRETSKFNQCLNKEASFFPCVSLWDMYHIRFYDQCAWPSINDFRVNSYDRKIILQAQTKTCSYSMKPVTYLHNVHCRQTRMVFEKRGGSLSFFIFQQLII